MDLYRWDLRMLIERRSDKPHGFADTKPNRWKANMGCELVECPEFELKTKSRLVMCVYDIDHDDDRGVSHPPPRKPAPSEEWRVTWPTYLSTYDIILDAEDHPVQVQQVETDSSDQEASDNLMFARVAGYLVLEFFIRRVILTETPCVSPSREFGTARDVVFAIGSRGRENPLSLCVYGLLLLHLTSQFLCSLEIYQEVYHTLLASLVSFRRHV